MASSKEKGDFLNLGDPKNKDRGEKEPLYSTRTGHMERTMFVVDLSRLKAEGDTLENALVLYRPVADIKMLQYEQRCSQLVGMALCTMNFTGKYPEYLRMKGVGYAIKALGDQYLMGLSSRIEEPPASVINHLKNVHDYFQFYYHSPSHVMKSCQNDWEIFNRSMSQIFHFILTYLAVEQHSVPVMLNPLPYVNTRTSGKNIPRLFLLASRLLRACQQHQSIIGGCIIHNSKIFTSQFEPLLTEKLTLASGGGVELNRLSILEDDIAPNKVWVLEVFLTPDEVDAASNSRKDHIAYQAAYGSLDTNPHLTTSTLNWRFQISQSANTNNSSSSSTHKPRGNWRNRPSASSKSARVVSPAASGIKASRTTPDLANHTKDHDYEDIDFPVAASTPQQRKPSQNSEDAIVMNLVSGSVSYSPQTSHKFTSTESDLATTSFLSSSKKQDQHEELPYVDAMEDIDPTLLPPVETRDSTSSATSGDSKNKETRDSRPQSTSSETFSTPPPTPYQDKPPVISAPLKITDGLGLLSEENSTSLSFKTASAGDTSVSLRGEDEEESVDGSDTLTRGTGVAEIPRADLNDKEIEKIVNTPIAAKINVNHRPLSMLSGSTPTGRVAAFSSPLRSWKFKSEPVADDSDESDFVSSTELQEMILESKKRSESNAPQVNLPDSKPPPLPPRNPPKVQEEEILAPPLPPRPGSSKQSSEREKENQDSKSRTKDSHETTPIPTEGEAPVIKENNSVIMNGTGPEEDVNTTHSEIDDTHKISSVENVPNGVVNTSSTGTSTETSEEASAHEIKPDKEGSRPQPVTNGDDVVDNSEARDDVQNETKEVNTKETVGQNVDRTCSPTNKSPVNELSEHDSIVEDSDLKQENTDQTNNQTNKESEKSTPNNPSENSPDIVKNIPESDQNGPLESDQNGPSEGDQTENGPSSDHSDQAEIKPDSPVEVEEVEVFLDEEEEEEQEQQQEKEGEADQQEEEVTEQESINTSRAPFSVSESLASEMSLPVDESIMTEAPSGTVTPEEMTLNESFMNIAALRLAERKEEEEDGEYSSAPEDMDESFEVLDGGDGSVKNSTLTGHATGSRPRSSSWLSKTMKRQQQALPAQDQSLKSMCLYVQLHMNTMVLLLGDNGLHKDYTVLNSLWRSLLPQLLELDTGLKGERGLNNRNSNDSQPKPHNYFVTVSNYDRYCEAQPNTASFQYRHAVRRIHQEYNKDPSLLQISLSKEHVRVLSQCVHQREVYFQPGRVGQPDALSMHGAIEKYAKFKTSLRQQPIGGPKVMFI